MTYTPYTFNDRNNSNYSNCIAIRFVFHIFR